MYFAGASIGVSSGVSGAAEINNFGSIRGYLFRG
jgi:hypothetical protein